jgi:hypothetical protein
MVMDFESKQVKSMEELNQVSDKLQEIECKKLNHEWNVENLNAEINALKDRCSRQQDLFKEKFQCEINKLKSEYSVEKCKLAKEITKLADKAHDLQVYKSKYKLKGSM